MNRDSVTHEALSLDSLRFPVGLTQIKGPVSSGKTWLALNLARAFTEAHPEKKVLYCSMELPEHLLLKRWQSLGANRHQIIVHDPGGQTPESIVRVCKDTIAHQSLSAVFIDYQQLLIEPGSATPPKHVEDLRPLDQLAKELACPIILLAQLSPFDNSDFRTPGKHLTGYPCYFLLPLNTLNSNDHAASADRWLIPNGSFGATITAYRLTKSPDNPTITIKATRRVELPAPESPPNEAANRHEAKALDALAQWHQQTLQIYREEVDCPGEKPDGLYQLLILSDNPDIRAAAYALHFQIEGLPYSALQRITQSGEA